MPHFRVERTPSALHSGASQRDQITRLIGGCAFGVVLLDGLRPNVVFEYGVLHGLNKPVIFFKEKQAQVDIRGYFGNVPNMNLEPVALDMDKHFWTSRISTTQSGTGLKLRTRFAPFGKNTERRETNSRLHRDTGAKAMYVKTGTGRFVYGELQPPEPGRDYATLGGDVQPKFAVEIIREYSANELVGKLCRRGYSGEYVPYDPGMIESQPPHFPRGSQTFEMAGSGPWKVLHLRIESDEAGPT